MKKPAAVIPRRSASGFTLMEVMLAIAMVAMIMVAVYGTLYTTIKARDQIEKESLIGKIGPSIMDLIEKDFTGAFCMNIHDNDVFHGEDFNINGEPADRFDMITTTDSTIVETSDEEPIRSDLTEVGYRLRQNPTAPDLMELWRRQDFHVDDKIAEDGNYELIYSRVKSLQITYLRDLYEGADEFDEWDAKKRNTLPAAIRVILRIEIDPRLAGYNLDDMGLRPTLEYHRIIFFPQGSALTMATRPVIPTFVEPEGDTGPGVGGGAPGGGRGGGEGEGGEGGMGPGEGLEPGEGIGSGSGGPGGGFKPGDKLPDFPDPGDKQGLPGGDVNIEDLLKLLGGLK